MEQEYTVVFSERAVGNLDTIVSYLANNWSQQVKTDFLVIMSEKVERIGRMPYLYKTSTVLPNCRECVINHLTVLYYRIDEEKKVVQIITIQSTRTDGIS